MKRIVTIFLVGFLAFAGSANAQVQTARSLQKPITSPALTTTALPTGVAHPLTPLTPSEENPLAVYKTESVSYIQDTTNGNWWVYAPVLNQSTGDSLGNLTFNPTFYFQAMDSIGPTGFAYVNNLGLQIDTTAFDTMYNRVMCLRISPPKDLGSPIKLDSLQISFFPESIDPADKLTVLAVPCRDEQFNDGSLNPVPAIFGLSASEGVIATESIPASKMTVGQINTLTVNFAGKSISNTDERNQMAICVYVDGPHFANDTVGYVLEADLQNALGASLVIDTDGSQGEIQGPDSAIAMRTYRLNLDGGNIVIGNEGSSYIGGGGGFFVDFPQFDPTSGQPTGQAFEGNLAITTFFHGTALAGVAQGSSNGYSLDGNYPNPVSTTTDISYTLGASGPVTLDVYNTLGQKVGSVVNNVQSAGAHTATFNTGTLPNGLYYYKLQSGEFNATNTMVIAR